MPCILTKLSSLFGPNYTKVEGVGSSDANPRPDTMEQLAACMNAVQNCFQKVLAVVPLLKGLQSRVNRSSRRHSQKQHRNTPSPPPTHRHVPKEIESSSSGGDPQWAGPSQLRGPSPFFKVSVPFALTALFKLAGTPVVNTVAHPLSAP